MLNQNQAYCIRCHKETPINGSQTVVLRNNSRAMTGMCAECEGAVYRILPPKTEADKDTEIAALREKVASLYPDAYCMKCREHTLTTSKHTVVLGNDSRALKGLCAKCHSPVYRMMRKKA